MRGFFYSPLRKEVYMPISKGSLHEDEMIEFLNNKQVKTLSNNLRNMVVELFGVVDPEETIQCEHAIDYTKPDFVVTYKGKQKYVSMKSGNGELVHHENIDTFCKFLESIGVSNETITTIKLHQFGDGTIDGTGVKRYELSELKYALRDRIKKANFELNQIEIVVRVAERVLFQGVNPDVPEANAIYHGTFEYGVMANKKQILKYINAKKARWAFYDNLHIGPFFLRPHARYINTEIKSEKSRRMIDLHWPRMYSDIDYISHHFDSYTPVRFRTYEE